MKNCTINQIKQVLFGAESVLIISHIHPDGDTIGSVLSFREILISLGKSVDIACEDKIPEKYSYIQDASFYKQSNEIDKTYSVYMFLDCATDSRVGSFYKYLGSKYTSINIDHHVSNQYFATYNYVGQNSSCCELLYELYIQMGYNITQKIAEYLLMGISTDTGNFAHSNTTSKTLKIASELVALGADLYKINKKMFKSQSKARSDLYLKVMGGIKYHYNNKLAIAKITKADFEEFGLDSSVTEGFIDYLMSIAGVEVGICIMESKEKTYKISFRSSGNIDVNDLASTFGGGGHKFASGAVMRGYLEDVIDKLVYTCGIYLE